MRIGDCTHVSGQVNHVTSHTEVNSAWPSHRR